MSLLVTVTPRPEITETVTRGGAPLMAALGYAPLLEAPLPNGRRADVYSPTVRA